MQKFINTNDLIEMEKQERVHLINSLGGFKSVCLVGTKNKANQTNLAIFSSIIHIGANPALIGIIFRPAAYERHTLDNILETKFYTVNHINEDIYMQAHQTSARYDKVLSEFDATGLNTEYKNDFFAPFVKESHIQLGLNFKQKIDLEINNTVLVIGEIIQIYFPENCQNADGFLDLEIAQTITCSGLDSYHKTKKINRLSYAKTDKVLTTI
ncbi:flavin reductase family protein [Flavobacterium sp.]|uniref:flavin reductase family protein n=1 Tax=Flavobacterium sp. TaxID=239 RepID=UPI0038FC7C03